MNPVAAMILGGALLAAAAAPRPTVDLTDKERQLLARHSPAPALPKSPPNAVADDPAAAHLGQFLFFDARLSANGEVSCATCHDPKQAFADGRPRGRGLDDLPRHTPSLLNTAHNRWFYWDGRRATLWSQALVPFETAEEMGGSRVRVARVIAADPALRSAYEAVFGAAPILDAADRFAADARPVPGQPEHPHQQAWAAMSAADREAIDRVFANVGKAIAAYERRLLATRAPFDEFVEGVRTGDAKKLAAISPSAQRGWKLFAGRASCRLCHFGPMFTDGEFHSTGIAPEGGGPLTDPGRYAGIPQVKAGEFNAAGPYSDERDGAKAKQVLTLRRSPETWGQFKTPSLRNVARTPPYMHQGQLATLRDVVRHYSTLEDAVLPDHHQEQLLVPLHLTDGEIDDLVEFLESLSAADPPAKLLEQPSRPKFGPNR
ncbi:MAG: cytochrome-c peroxidase [Planctomycetota bacterium]|jgi:cytochrome c peroxidase